MAFRSLLVICSLLVLGCEDGPDVWLCSIEAEDQQLYCVKGKRDMVVPINDADGWFAMPPDDMRTVIEYCDLKGEKKK